MEYSPSNQLLARCQDLQQFQQDQAIIQILLQVLHSEARALQAAVDPVGEGDLLHACSGLATATRHSALGGEAVQIQRPEGKSSS